MVNIILSLVIGFIFTQSLIAQQDGLSQVTTDLFAQRPDITRRLPIEDLPDNLYLRVCWNKCPEGTCVYCDAGNYNPCREKLLHERFDRLKNKGAQRALMREAEQLYDHVAREEDCEIKELRAQHESEKHKIHGQELQQRPSNNEDDEDSVGLNDAIISQSARFHRSAARYSSSPSSSPEDVSAEIPQSLVKQQALSRLHKSEIRRVWDSSSDEE